MNGKENAAIILVGNYLKVNFIRKYQFRNKNLIKLLQFMYKKAIGVQKISNNHSNFNLNLKLIL